MAKSRCAGPVNRRRCNCGNKRRAIPKATSTRARAAPRSRRCAHAAPRARAPPMYAATRTQNAHSERAVAACSRSAHSFSRSRKVKRRAQDLQCFVCAKVAMFCGHAATRAFRYTHRTSGARRRHSSKVLCDFMSLTDGVDEQPLYDTDSLNSKQRRGADRTFKIQAAREAKKASKGNTTSTSRVLPDHGCLVRLAAVARENTVLHATAAAATLAATPDATMLQNVTAISPAIGNQPQTCEEPSCSPAMQASAPREIVQGFTQPSTTQSIEDRMPREQHSHTSFEAIDPDSDVDKHEQTQHPLNNPTSMDDAGSNDTEQDQSRMTSHDSAALAYISAAVDSLCGVAKRHGHTVVSFEAYHSKVVLGNSNTARVS